MIKVVIGNPDSTAFTLAEWASIATIAGVAVGLLGGIIALITYYGNLRAAERAHFHSIFREYLRMRADHNCDGSKLFVMGFKFYVMEEAYLWLGRAKRRWFRPWGMNRQSHSSWIATIDHHLTSDTEGAKAYFLDRNQIFDERFQAYVCERLGIPYPVQTEIGNGAPTAGGGTAEPTNGQAEGDPNP